MLSRRVIAYYGLIRASESSAQFMNLLQRLLHPRKRLRAGIQRFPNLLRWTVLACRLPYPGGPRVQMTVASSSELAFAFWARARRSHWSFRGCRVHSSLNHALILRPASWLALLSRTFTFELSLAGHPGPASSMTTWVNNQFPRPDFHRQVLRHYGLQTQILTRSDPKIRGQEPKTLSKRAHNPLWKEAG